MKKKIFYIVVSLLVLLPFLQAFLKTKYSNVFEEIYHDEYYHATTAFLRTNSTLNSVPDIEDSKVAGPLYGVISERYRTESLPSGIKEISYDFYFLDDKLEGSEMIINFRFLHTNGDYIDVYYRYKHNSDKLVQLIGILGEERLTDIDQIVKYVKEKKINLSPYFSKSEELLRNKLIPDWLKVYSSRFTKDDWGDIQIVYANVDM